MDPVLSRGTLAHDRSKRCENQINRLEDSEEEKTNQGLEAVFRAVVLRLPNAVTL